MLRQTGLGERDRVRRCSKEGDVERERKGKTEGARPSHAIQLLDNANSIVLPCDRQFGYYAFDGNSPRYVFTLFLG